jgi:hypothetical protein
MLGLISMVLNIVFFTGGLITTKEVYLRNPRITAIEIFATGSLV